MEIEAVRYGVAHTPPVIADFMARSAVDVLAKDGVGIDDIFALDPFTGDGVFIAALVKCGVKRICAYEIRREQSAKTIEQYGGIADIFCTDAFKMKPRGFNLIIGNPPYGNCAENVAVDARIRETYGGSAVNQTALYDGYVRAIRWATDNMGRGVICYIVNNAFLESVAFAAFRKRIESEFVAVYIFNLRGNHRTSGELCRKEAGNVFGHEARVGIAVLLLEKCGEAYQEQPSLFESRELITSEIEKVREVG